MRMNSIGGIASNMAYYTKEEKEKLSKLYGDISVGSYCPHCQIGMIRQVNGKWGKFLGCDKYPQCAFKLFSLTNEKT